jgi:hypothetical protein
LLWELLTGQRPFSEDNQSGSWSAILETMVERRSKKIDTGELARAQNCPGGLISVLETALEPDRDRRWQRGLEIARRLELCTDPKISALLFPPVHSARVRLRPFLVVVLWLVAGLPTILALAFHYKLNVTRLTTGLSPQQLWLLEQTQAAIGAGALAVGAAVLTLLGYSVHRGIKQCQSMKPTNDEVRARRWAGLRLGPRIATFIFLVWLIATGVDAIALKIAHLDPSTQDLPRFLLWTLMCSCLAAALPFFGITFFSLRSIYPAFVQHDLEGAVHDDPLLKKLNRWKMAALIVAVLAPLLSIAALIADKVIDPNISHSEGELAVGLFCAVSLVGLLPVFWLYQLIQADLTTYSNITVPHERPSRSLSASRSGSHRVPKA